MSYLLGIDISTTATKAILVRPDGRVAGVHAAPHRLMTPRPLWSEQDPAEWWEATQVAVRGACNAAGVSGSEVSAIGLGGQMHGLVLLGRSGDVLRPAILWNDQRASAECDEIRDALGLERLVALTGNDAFPGFSAPKLQWVRKHEPEVAARIHQVLLPKDYVRFCMTGAYATDRAGAGGTLLLDLRTRDWSAEVLDALDIPREWLSPTFEGTAVTGTLTSEAAEALGLASGTPVVGGGGDQAAQAVGVGAVSPDVFALTVGTSGVVFAPCAAPTVDRLGRAHAFPHALPGMWHVMGVMLSAAGSMQWYRDTLAPGTAFDALTDEAAGVGAGADGLTFLPYLSGERTPHADPFARGGFVGLALSHGRGHLTRAVMEGVAFGLRDNLELLADAGLPRPSRLVASGGALKSPLWTRILADILQVELAVVEATEGAAMGAALLAGMGIGVWPSIEEACRGAVRIAHTVSPEAAGDYADAYARFRALYPAIKPHFPRN